MTVADLSERLSEEELTYWMAYNLISPFGDFRQDVAGAQICAVLANINRDKKKRPNPYEIRDFLPFNPRKQQKKQTVEEMKEVLTGLVISTKKGKK